MDALKRQPTGCTCRQSSEVSLIGSHKRAGIQYEVSTTTITVSPISQWRVVRSARRFYPCALSLCVNTTLMFRATTGMK